MDSSSDLLPYTNTSLTKLVDACLHGDAEAWHELIRRYAKLVHSVPVRYGLAPMEVDDIGQEVFFILTQNLHQIEDPERLPSWLLTTARRATWRMIQKRRREHPSDAGALSDDAGDERTPH
ncbi:MAG: sigma-70 family RNA polymerase sigma factor, partial [Caldilineaceae bacterium]